MNDNHDADSPALPAPPTPPTIESLVQDLERLLHEVLPDVCRDSQDELIAPVMQRLNNLQRQIGMLTFEEMRKRPQRARHYIDDIGIQADSGAPLPRMVPRVTPTCGFCARTDGLITCGSCGKAVCPNHSDSALHPCGEELL